MEVYTVEDRRPRVCVLYMALYYRNYLAMSSPALSFLPIKCKQHLVYPQGRGPGLEQDVGCPKWPSHWQHSIGGHLSGVRTADIQSHNESQVDKTVALMADHAFLLRSSGDPQELLPGKRVGYRGLCAHCIMVRNVDDLDFHLPSHAQDMLEGLQRLRSLPKLADVTLLVGDQELPCHRSLLALNSPYFHAMFAGDFAESFSARVELRDVEPAVVGQLVDFVYTGRLTITQTNVEALTRSASRLHFPTVQKVCGRYLQQQLDATNCLGICEFGEQQGLLGVAAKAWAFLRENFEAVAQEDEFLQLPRDRLATCLASDLLQVQPEQSRLEALLRWVRHDPQARAAHLPELLSLVHLDAVPRPCVQQLLATEPLIQESEACQEALSQGHSAVSERPGTST